MQPLNRNLASQHRSGSLQGRLHSPIRLYCCESWTPYRQHIKALESYHIRCLQSILNIGVGGTTLDLLMSKYVVDAT